MKTYRLPPMFYEDHRSRDLPEQGTSVPVKETKTYWLVEMDNDALTDLYTDCLYYTDAATARDLRECGNGHLVPAARACLKALRSQAPDEVAVIDEQIAAQRRAWLTK